MMSSAASFGLFAVTALNSIWESFCFLENAASNDSFASESNNLCDIFPADCKSKNADKKVVKHAREVLEVNDNDYDALLEEWVGKYRLIICGQTSVCRMWDMGYRVHFHK